MDGSDAAAGAACAVEPPPTLPTLSESILKAWLALESAVEAAMAWWSDTDSESVGRDGVGGGGGDDLVTRHEESSGTRRDAGTDSRGGIVAMGDGVMGAMGAGVVAVGTVARAGVVSMGAVAVAGASHAGASAAGDEPAAKEAENTSKRDLKICQGRPR